MAIRRISDIPHEELMARMKEYGKKKAASTRSARIFLRQVGMNIDRNGKVVIPVEGTERVEVMTRISDVHAHISPSDRIRSAMNAKKTLLGFKAMRSAMRRGGMS